MLLGVSPLIASSSRRLTSEQVESERETAFKLVSLVYIMHTYSSYFNTMRS